VERAATLQHVAIAGDITLPTLWAPHHKADVLVTANSGVRQNALVMDIHVTDLDVGLHGRASKLLPEARSTTFERADGVKVGAKRASAKAREMTLLFWIIKMRDDWSENRRTPTYYSLWPVTFDFAASVPFLLAESGVGRNESSENALSRPSDSFFAR
jgi:hypothetical protein